MAELDSLTFTVDARDEAVEQARAFGLL